MKEGFLRLAEPSFTQCFVLAMSLWVIIFEWLVLNGTFVSVLTRIWCVVPTGHFHFIVLIVLFLAGYCLPIEMPPVLVQWNPVWNCTNGHCKYAWLELVSVCQECHWWGSWQLVMFLCILANGGNPTARWEHACKNGNVQVTAGSDCNVRLVTPTIWVFWAQPAFLYLVNILWVLLVGWHKQHAEYSEKSIVYFSLLIFWAFFL